jgi:hypothetical protein
MLGKKSRSICKANINNHWQPSCLESGERPVELQLGAITTYQSCRTCFTTYSLLQLAQHRERHIREYTNESSSRSGQRVCTVQHTCYRRTSKGFKRIDGLTGDVGSRCGSQRVKRRLHRISKETTRRCPEVSTRSHESCAGPDSADNGDGRSRREGTKWHKGMLLSVVYRAAKQILANPLSRFTLVLTRRFSWPGNATRDGGGVHPVPTGAGRGAEGVYE